MGKINAAWHQAHPMPKHPTDDERLAWHLDHLKHCQCRTDLPASVVKLMQARGIPVPGTPG